MQRAAVPLAIALAASVGANIYLWRCRTPQHSERTVAPQRTARRAQPERGSSSAIAAGVATPERATGAEPATMSCPEQLKSCDDSLSSCSGKLTSTTKELARYLPLDERFKRGAPNPAALAKIRPIVKAAFGGHMPAHDLSCRGDACRLELVLPQGKSLASAMRNLQGPKMLGKVTGIAFEGAEPTYDPVTGDPLTRQAIYLGVPHVGTADGEPLLADVIQRFKASGAAWRCYRDSPATGELVLRLDIGDRGASGIVVHVGGDLAATAAGRCLADRIRAVAAAETIPPEVSGAVRFYRITLPPTASPAPRVQPPSHRAVAGRRVAARRP